MSEEKQKNEHDPLGATKRKYPLNKDEMFPLREALFSRSVLEPLFEQWSRESTSSSAESFYRFLLNQVKK